MTKTDKHIALKFHEHSQSYMQCMWNGISESNDWVSQHEWDPSEVRLSCRPKLSIQASRSGAQTWPSPAWTKPNSHVKLQHAAAGTSWMQNSCQALWHEVALKISFAHWSHQKASRIFTKCIKCQAETSWNELKPRSSQDLRERAKPMQNLTVQLHPTNARRRCRTEISTFCSQSILDPQHPATIHHMTITYYW